MASSSSSVLAEVEDDCGVRGKGGVVDHGAHSALVWTGRSVGGGTGGAGVKVAGAGCVVGGVDCVGRCSCSVLGMTSPSPSSSGAALKYTFHSVATLRDLGKETW